MKSKQKRDKDMIDSIHQYKEVARENGILIALQKIVDFASGYNTEIPKEDLMIFIDKEVNKIGSKEKS